MANAQRTGQRKHHESESYTEKCGIKDPDQRIWMTLRLPLSWSTWDIDQKHTFIMMYLTIAAQNGSIFKVGWFLFACAFICVFNWLITACLRVCVRFYDLVRRHCLWSTVHCHTLVVTWTSCSVNKTLWSVAVILFCPYFIFSGWK